jgi:hypothetical protein
MAHVVIDGQMLTVKMSRWERLGAQHRDVTVPLAAVTAVSTTEDPWTIFEGIRAPGTGIPGVIMLGTLRSKGSKTFCAVYRHGPALVITTTDPAFARLIVSASDASEQAAALSAQLDVT